jgi:hypothetical protein
MQTKTQLQYLFKDGFYIELLGLLRTLVAHYATIDPELSSSFEQIAQTLDPVVVKVRDQFTHDEFLYKSLTGVLYYFKCCFRDNKLHNSDEVNETLYDNFSNALNSKSYFRMYGMLLGCQEQFQQPDKSLIFDIIYEHLITLCPVLG